MSHKSISLIFLICVLVGCTKPYVASKGAVTGQDHIKNILVEAENIREVSENPVITGAAENIQDEAVKVEKIIVKQDKALFEAKNSYYQMYQRWLTTIMLLSGLTIGISIALFIMGKLPSLTITVIAVGAFTSAVVLQFLSAWFVWIAGGSLLLLVGLLIYQIYIKNRSTKEIVQSVQEGIKEGAVNIEKFGPIADKIQKGPAKKIVDSVQKIITRKKK